MRGVDGKRVYLVCYEADQAPKWFRWLLKFRIVRKLWRMHCIRKVNKLSAGEVMYRYYEVTDHVE